MLVAHLRPLLLGLCTAASFVVLGRAPGAITLRTREVELGAGWEVAGVPDHGAHLPVREAR